MLHFNTTVMPERHSVVFASFVAQVGVVLFYKLQLRGTNNAI